MEKEVENPHNLILEYHICIPVKENNEHGPYPVFYHVDRREEFEQIRDFLPEVNHYAYHSEKKGRNRGIEDYYPEKRGRVHELIPVIVNAHEKSSEVRKEYQDNEFSVAKNFFR